MEETEFTFGEKAVGLNYPTSNESVLKIKQQFAEIIDTLNDFRNDPLVPGECKRHASIAITDLETAHLIAVQSLIWVEK